MDRHLPIVDPSSEPPLAGNRSRAEANRKLRDLLEHLGPLVENGVLVAFSGGMDSAFLLWAAREAGKETGGRVVALTTTSASTPARDKEDARSFSESLGIEHVWAESEEMTSPEYTRNTRDRCYHCKKELFSIASSTAADQKLPWLLYGYNASDQDDDRPGHRAALEAGARTPLSDVGLTKPEIRWLMAEAGVPLSHKPASPCLSSRITTGIEITTKRLADVEVLEDILKANGGNTVRVRICREERGREFIRIEVGDEDMDTVLRARETVLREGLERGYLWVTLDLGGYRTGGGVG